MSDQEMDGLEFEHRTTTNSFHERLLQAKEDDNGDEMNDRINFDELFDSDDIDQLQRQLEKLQVQVERMETKVNNMEDKLAFRKKKRVVKASLTNMTPEERADYVEQEEKEEQVDDTPDLDVVFEYLLLLSSAPADDINDFAATDLIKPHAGIRKKVLENNSVIKQETYSSLHFIKAENILESNTEAEGEIRHCELAGTSNNIEFTITFDVLEPAMIMSNLVFDINIEMQLDIGDVLERIKQECNLLGFFRVLTHYGLLEKERKEVFDKLTKEFSNTYVHVELLSQSRLMIEGTASVYLIFEWKTITVNTDRYRLDANTTDHVKPQLSLEIFNLDSTNNVDMANQMNEKFMTLVKMQGVYKAMEIIINKLFMPSKEA